MAKGGGCPRAQRQTFIEPRARRQAPLWLQCPASAVLTKPSLQKVSVFRLLPFEWAPSGPPRSERLIDGVTQAACNESNGGFDELVVGHLGLENP